MSHMESTIDNTTICDKSSTYVKKGSNSSNSPSEVVYHVEPSSQYPYKEFTGVRTKSHETILPVPSRMKMLRSSGPECIIVHRGTLNVRVGPMFSDKTTWLNGEMTRFADRGFSVVKIVHDDDNRDDTASNEDSGSTHNSSYKSLSPKIKIIRALEINDLNISAYHVVGVDEGQFFGDLYNTVKSWVANGKHVRVAGLDGDFNMKKFGQVVDLCPIADEFIKLKASCRICLDELEKVGFHGNILAIEGPFTKHLGELPKGQKDVGGAEKYIPVCRYHHMIK